jgi:hypothetical protein
LRIYADFLGKKEWIGDCDLMMACLVVVRIKILWMKGGVWFCWWFGAKCANCTCDSGPVVGLTVPIRV